MQTEVRRSDRLDSVSSAFSYHKSLEEEIIMTRHRRAQEREEDDRRLANISPENLNLRGDQLDALLVLLRAAFAEGVFPKVPGDPRVILAAADHIRFPGDALVTLQRDKKVVVRRWGIWQFSSAVMAEMRRVKLPHGLSLREQQELRVLEILCREAERLPVNAEVELNSLLSRTILSELGSESFELLQQILRHLDSENLIRMSLTNFSPLGQSLILLPVRVSQELRALVE
jgi:hypothetical protein